MAVNEHTPGPLPCGTDPATVYDHLAAGAANTHQQTCPHCQQLAASLEPVREATAQLAARKPQPPTRLTDSVMARVRAELRHSRQLPLPAEPPSRLSVSEHAAAAILSAAAAAVPGAISRGCRFPDPADPAHISISISLRYGLRAATIAGRVRAAIRAAAQTQLGLPIRRIDINIDDIHRPH
jgi:hypothetical protein